MFRIAVTTESRTFLLFESAQALAHSKILASESERDEDGKEEEEMRRGKGGGGRLGEKK